MATVADPLEIRGVRFRNRIVGAPMERNYCTLEGVITERYVAYLRERAAGGAALLFTEAAYVEPGGRGRSREMGAHAAHVVPGLRRMADAVHAEGALIGVELNHGGRVVSSAASGHWPVAPSPVPCDVTGGEVPRELTTAEVTALVESFAAATRRCLQAGVDVISIHAAHGYLIHQFLSPRTNSRLAGERYARPSQFLEEVVAAVRAQGEDFPLFLRVSAFEGVEGGLDQRQTLDALASADLEGVDVIDVSAGTYESGEWIVQPGEVPQGFLAEAAAEYRRLGRLVSVAGRISLPGVAEDIVRQGRADLVSVARAIHADPAWPRAVLDGRDARPCIACNQGCIDHLGTHLPIWCVANPDAGEEWTARAPARGEAGRLVVVGGGLAGLESARTAAAAGWDTVLFEAEPELGGQHRLAGLLPSRPEFGRLTDWLGRELERLGVQVRAGERATADGVHALAPEALIVATGARGCGLSVPGAETRSTLDVRDWLAQNPQLEIDRPITVYGADRVGVAVADGLVTRGAEVLLIGPETELAPEAGRREKILALPRLAEHATVRLHTTLEAIDGDALRLAGPEGAEWIRRSGPLLVSRGTVAVLPDLLNQLDPSVAVDTVGEARGVATAGDAIRGGRRITERLIARAGMGNRGV